MNEEIDPLKNIDEEIFAAAAALLFLYFYEVGLSTQCGNVKPINPFFLFHSLFWGGVL